MKVLNLLPRIPTPAVDGGAIAVLRTMLALKKQGVEWVIASLLSNRHLQDLDECRSHFITYTVPVHFPEMNAFNAVGTLFDPLPYNIALRYRHLEIQPMLEQIRHDHPDIRLIQIEWVNMGLHIDVVRSLWPGTPIILRQHNVEFRLMERLAERQRSPLKRWFIHRQATRMRILEANVISKVDHLITLTELDREQFMDLFATAPSSPPMTVVPAGIDVERYRRPEGTVRNRDFLIIGSLGWEPYAESVKWFIEKVWIPFHSSHPGTRLRIVGNSSPPYLNRHHLQNGVDIAGFVEDVMPEFHQSLAMVLPLRSGSGMRLKVLEAAASSLPVISTALGVEGIPLEDKRSCLIAETPPEWMTAMELILNDPATAESLAKASQSVVEEFSVDRCAGKTLEIFRKAGTTHQGRG